MQVNEIADRIALLQRSLATVRPVEWQWLSRWLFSVRKPIGHRAARPGSPSRSGLGRFRLRQLVRAGGLEPPRDKPDGFSYQLRLSPPPPMGRLWSGLSLHRAPRGLGAARLVSTPSPCGAWLGIASEGFPDFEQFYVPGFPGRTQILAFKSGASTSFATPAYRPRL